MPAMLSTASLIEPIAPHPSFSGPEPNRAGWPAVIITREDQQTSVDQIQLLITNAKAYRLQMLALSMAAANFGYALEKIAHSKAAVGDLSNVSSNLQAASGLHYLMSNHHQILSDTMYKQFEIPLLQHIDTHKGNIEASLSQYERMVKDKSQKIMETEAASLLKARKGTRYIDQFRQSLATQQRQVDELERIKLNYYVGNLESEQSNLQLILQKTSTIVRAEMEIYERIANKGLNDAILEPMTTQGPDPYCIYPTTDEFSSIFSILPPTPIISTSGAGTTGSSTPQPDAIMSNFYGYHETNLFSTSRKPNNTSARDRHLFGDVSSIESKESSALFIARTTSPKESQTMTEGKDAADDSDDQTRPSQANTGDADDADKSSGLDTPTAEKAVKILAVHQEEDEGEDLEVLSAKELKEPEEFVAQQELDTPQPSPSKVTSEQNQPMTASSNTSGVDLGSGQLHHRHRQTGSKDDIASHAATSPSELASSVRSYSLRSRSGSRSHHLLASTPDSPPVRGMIHISQDSELLNNRDFSFSYEPSDLLEQRNMHSQLNLSRHSSQSALQAFGGFAEMDEEDEGFGGTSPMTHRDLSNQQQTTPSPVQHHSRSYSQHLQSLRHHSSDGQLSHSSSSNLSSVGSTNSGSSGPNSLHHRRSTGRMKTDFEATATTTVTFEASFLEESFMPSSMSIKRQMEEDRESRRGYDDGIPAFFADEVEDSPVPAP
ncbi:hypothetical protein BGZ98_003868, partial [Dissophora globulifera]